MNIARLSGSLTKPWEIIRREFDGVFGEPRQCDDEFQWQSTSFRFLRLKAQANPSTGQVDVVVSTELPYTPLAVSSTVLMLWLVLFATSTYAVFVGLNLCLLLAISPPVAGWRNMRFFHDRTSEVLSIEEVSCTPVILVPIVGYVSGLWVFATSLMAKLLALLISIFIIPFVMHITSIELQTLRNQFPLWALVLFSTVPFLTTAINFGLLTLITDLSRTPWIAYFVLIIVIHTIVLLVVYLYLCRRFLLAVQFAPNKPISSVAFRIVWGGYFVCLNVGLLVTILTPFIDRWGLGVVTLPVDQITAGFSSAGFLAPKLMTMVSLAILSFPLVGLSGLWVLHFVRQLRNYKGIYANSEPAPSIDTNIPIRVVETSRIVAHPLRTISGKQAILLSTGLVNELDDEEVAAVVAHESYHLQNKDLLRDVVAAVCGLFVGGKNILVALFDYPKIEREADKYAADQEGTEPLLRALRRLSNKRSGMPQSRATGFKARSLRSWLYAAPYHVLFGSVLVENAHASVDERVEYILEQRIE